MRRIQAKLDDWRGQREHSRQWDLENFRQIISLSQNALRSAMLINGGAAVALLAFAGNLLQNGGDPTPFTCALAMFGGGVAISAIAASTTYAAQYFYGAVDKLKFGKIFHFITVLLFMLAIGMFVWGIKMGYDGFSENQPAAVIAFCDDTEKKNAPPPKRPPEEPPTESPKPK